MKIIIKFLVKLVVLQIRFLKLFSVKNREFGYAMYLREAEKL